MRVLSCWALEFNCPVLRVQGVWGLRPWDLRDGLALAGLGAFALTVPNHYTISGLRECERRVEGADCSIWGCGGFRLHERPGSASLSRCLCKIRFPKH